MANDKYTRLEDDLNAEDVFDERIAQRCKVIGENVRHERKRRKFSIEDLASYIELSASYVGLLERGDRCPSLKSLFRLCDLFHCEPNDLLTKRVRDGGGTLRVAEQKLPYHSGYEALLSLLQGLDDKDYAFLGSVVKAYRKYNKQED